MVDDGSYSCFPWGKVAFEKLMAFISRSMNDVQKFYRLSGMPYVLQNWWYECCAAADESLVIHVHNLISRMVNWKVVKPKPRYEDLMDDMLKTSAGVEKLLLSKSDLDDIKSYVKTYVAQYPLHESEKSIPDREGDPPQSLNEHKMDAKSDNVIEDAGQSSKVGGNKAGAEECLKEAESSYTKKVQKEDRHNTAAEADEGMRDERIKIYQNDTYLSICIIMIHIDSLGTLILNFIITLTSLFTYGTRDSEEALHNIDEDLSKDVTFYVRPSTAVYPTGIIDIVVTAIDTCNQQGNTDS
ncbi:hypothetical protein FXO38_00512 [Capsicum annuum]|nr:hypothetical protein FXO38_00512 [Capsicum annuum]KAF3685443.1 hypothetical protein FXO37_00614 [Capsicum annuum]